MQVEIYCDGSCNTQTNIGAWAALIYSSLNQYEIGDLVKETTNQAMELQAVISALTFIEKNRILPEMVSSSILIYTDSQYVCNLPLRRTKLERQRFLNKKNNELPNYKKVQILYNFLDKFRISIIKIKAHQKRGQSIVSDRLRQVDKKARSMVRTIIKQDSKEF